MPVNALDHYDPAWIQGRLPEIPPGLSQPHGGVRKATPIIHEDARVGSF